MAFVWKIRKQWRHSYSSWRGHCRRAVALLRKRPQCGWPDAERSIRGEPVVQPRWRLAIRQSCLARRLSRRAWRLGLGWWLGLLGLRLGVGFWLGPWLGPWLESFLGLATVLV